MQVVEKASGRTVDIPDEQFQAGFQSGAYALPKGTRVPVQRDDGEIGTVPVEGLEDEIARGGAVLPQADYDKAANEKQYGGIGGMAATAPLSVLGGATLNASDALIGAVGGPDAKKYLRGLYKTNPITHTVGQVGGALLPAIATDGASVAGEGALGLAEGADALNAARVAGAAGRLAPETAALAPELGAAADVANVAQVAKPGLASTVARKAYNTVLAPSTYTSEAGKVVERLVGSVIGDNSPSLLARTARRAIAKGGAGALEGAIINVSNELSEDVLGDKDIAGQKLFAAAGHGALFGALLGSGTGAATELGGAALSKIARSETLQKISENQIWRSLNPTKQITKEADKYVVGGHRSVARQVLDDGIPEVGDTIETMAPKIHAKKLSAFEDQNKLLDEITTQGAKGVPYWDLQKSIDKDIPDIIKKLGSHTPEARAIEKEFRSLQEMTGEDGRIGLRDLNDYRRYLDDHINHESALTIKAVDSPTTRILKGMRYNIEEAFMKQADSEMSRITGSAEGLVAKEWKRLKSVSQKYIVADRAATQAVGGMYGNQAHSLTDKMAGIGGAVAGFVASGGASLPAHVLHAGLGLAAGSASKFVRERGNATVGVALRKARDLGAVAQVTKRFDARLAKEVARAVQGQPYRSAPVDLDEYDGVAARVRAAKSADTHGQAVDRHLGSLQDTAPKVSGAFGSTARRATLYLASKLPEQSTKPMAKEMPPTAAEKSALMRASRAIEDPLVILKDIRSGTLTPDTIEAVKTVHPQLWANIQAEIAKELDSDKTIPYSRKMQMAAAVGLDLDGTLDQNFIAAQQAIYATPPQKSESKSKHRAANLQSKRPQSVTLRSRDLLSPGLHGH